MVPARTRTERRSGATATPNELYYSRHGDDLYRLHRKAGIGLVAEEWVACAWRDVSDLDYVVYRTTPISARAAGNLIEMRCGPGFRPSGRP